jgi:hypothetical protein
MAPLLSDQIEPTYYTSTADLYAAVDNEILLAGFISGKPDSTYTSFSSELISPRAFQMSSTNSEDLVKAVDAAVVRSHNAGDILHAMNAAPPFEAVEVHNCRTDDVSLVPFPPASSATGLLKDVLDNKKLKMLALGTPDEKPDWNEDGNYQVTPPVGFWPHYVDSFMAHFRAFYGDDIELERVWVTPSSNTSLVMSGEVHMTEPYYIYENFYSGTNELKKWSHDFSCIVMGYEQEFFVKKAKVVVNDDEDTQCAADLQECVNRRMEEQVSSKAMLNTHVESAIDVEGKTVGFLSMGNYNSISPLLSDQVVPMIFGDTDEINQAIENGTVIAGMISGQPHDNFHSFPTELISPRAFQMKPGADSVDLLRAVDAAVVRSHNAGDILTAMNAAPPFEAIEVHNCRVDNISMVPFPPASSATGLLKDVLDNKKLKILSLCTPGDCGPPDWNQDGNYQVNPPTGFWPHYMELFMGHFRAEYGDDIELERVWSRPSSNTSLVMSGEVHMTEPYYIAENLYDGTGQLKKWSHAFSCIVMGYEQQFFTMKAQVDFSDAGSSCELQLAECDHGQITSRACDHRSGLFGASFLGWLMISFGLLTQV